MVFGLLLLALGAAPGGACQQQDWACVAECIDRRCADACLRDRCARPLDGLRQCTQAEQCSGEDPTCARRRCGPGCAAAFGRPPKKPPLETKDPCARARGSVPADLAGHWVVRVASLEPVEARPGGDPAPQPRADYAQALTITKEGCFVLQTKLEDATLGQGNVLVVRGWGQVIVSEEELRLQTRSGQAVGQVCGAERVIGLEASRFLRPRFTYSVERGVLTLTTLDPDQQLFRLERAEPTDLRQEP